MEVPGASTRLLRAAVVLFVASIVALGGASIFVLTDDGPWTPIGDLPDQQVENVNVGRDELVRVNATKCFDEVPVKIAGVSYWRSEDSPGISVEASRASRIFDPDNPGPIDRWTGKCVVNHFENDIPETVFRWATTGLTRWKIYGEMTPQRASGNGVVRTWQTKQVITVDPKPLIILGPYPEQKVINVAENVVTIEGVLCSKKTVEVLTTISFQAFKAPYRIPQDSIAGAFVTVAANIQQTRTKGCTTFAGDTAFQNPITPAIKELDLSLGVEHRWRVVGVETSTGLPDAPFYSTAFELPR